MSETYRRQTGIGSSRSGFTLIELMVVMAIIGVLVTLTAAAAIGVLTYQHSQNTQTTLQTITTALNRQWTRVVEQARTETIPNSVMAMAGYNPDRA